MTVELSEAAWGQVVGHPSRLAILRRMLRAGSTTPAAAAREVGLKGQVMSFHFSFLLTHGVIRLAARSRGGRATHYTLVDRARTASVLWALRAELLTTDLERQHGGGTATVRLDPEALAEMREAVVTFVARLGELGIQTRERCMTAGGAEPELTSVALLLATDDANSGQP